MVILSLKFVIGAVSALMIVFTGVTALVITNSFTMSAIRDIGRDHASGIVQAASSKVSSFFDKAGDHMALTQETVRTGTWMTPSDTVAQGTTQWWLPWLDHMLRLHHTYNWTHYTMLFFGFTDGTWIYSSLQGTSQYSLLYFPNPSVRMVYLTLRLRANDTSVLGPLPYPPYNLNLFTLPLWFQNPLWQMNEKVWFPPSFTSFHPNGVATIGGAMHNASGVRFGKAAFSFNASAIRSFLRTISLTANSQAFLIDGLNMIFATTHPQVPSTFLGAFNASVRYPAGCYLDTSLDGGMVCRMTARTFPFAPLQELAATHEAVLNTSNSLTTGGAELMELRDSKFYVSVDTMHSTFGTGLAWKFVLLMPEDDITGGIVKGRNIAIGSVAAVCFVLVILAVVFIAFTLRPLERMSDRMYLCAELNDNEDEGPLSVLSEIALLQDSYSNLRTKMNEMKAFVPQALLHGNDYDADMESSQTVAREDALSASGTKHNNSRRSSTKGGSKDASDVQPHNGKPCVAEHHSDTSSQVPVAALRGLSVAASLVKRNVGVLCVNIIGFQRTVDSVAAGSALHMCEQIAREVHTQVREQKGVISIFHGDRFLVTFNAASPAASPAKRACVAAVRVRKALTQLQCRATSGISCGTALCGNTGCADLKGFSCVGSAVVQAVALERLAKLFSTRFGDAFCPILATGQCRPDIECELFFQIVDHVALPDPTLVLNVVAVKSAKEDEWMYQLRQNEAADPFMLVNKGFRCLQDGDTAGANNALTERAALLKGSDSPADEVGAVQLGEKLQHVGERSVIAATTRSHATTDHSPLALTDYGCYFSHLL